MPVPSYIEINIRKQMGDEDRKIQFEIKVIVPETEASVFNLSSITITLAYPLSRLKQQIPNW